MLRYHMVVVTPDKVLKRAVKRLTTATGASAQFFEEGSNMHAEKPIDLAIFDVRTSTPDKSFFDKIPLAGRIIYILSGQKSLTDKISLFEAPQATSLFCYNDQFDDDEFISSATKALRGDVFGLQKYFPWGVTTFTVLVKSYEDKTKAIDIMMSYAQMAGVRGPVRDRVQLVADELMMNALYHAPTDEAGNELYLGKTQKELAQLRDISPIEVQYGCSGHYFGISVRDGFGSLTRIKALDYLNRVGTDRARIEEKKGGAGLGLISVMQSVSKLIFNLDPGYSTEAIALFDMELQGKGMAGARSLHLFTANVRSPSAGNASRARDAAEDEPRSSGTWLIAALLGAVVAALGTAYVLKQQNKVPTQAAQAAKTLTVIASPTDARISIGGEIVASGVPITVANNEEMLQLEITAEGFDVWTKTVNPAEQKQSAVYYVDLQASE